MEVDFQHLAGLAGRLREHYTAAIDGMRAELLKGGKFSGVYDRYQVG